MFRKGSSSFVFIWENMFFKELGHFKSHLEVHHGIEKIIICSDGCGIKTAILLKLKKKLKSNMVLKLNKSFLLLELVLMEWQFMELLLNFCCKWNVTVCTALLTES